MRLRTLDECPTVKFVAELRERRRAEHDDHDPAARSSNEVPVDGPSRFEENPVNESLSRRSSGMPDPESYHESPLVESRAGEYSSSVVQNAGVGSLETAPRSEPEVEQPCESLAEGPPPSVSYLRTLFENHGPPAAPTNSIHSTNDELVTIEVATGEEEIEPLTNEPVIDYDVVRPISSYAFLPPS